MRLVYTICNDIKTGKNYFYWLQTYKRKTCSRSRYDNYAFYGTLVFPMVSAEPRSDNVGV